MKERLIRQELVSMSNNIWAPKDVREQALTLLQRWNGTSDPEVLKAEAVEFLDKLTAYSAINR